MVWGSGRSELEYMGPELSKKPRVKMEQFGHLEKVQLKLREKLYL